jgi:hypothetical protein
MRVENTQKRVDPKRLTEGFVLSTVSAALILLQGILIFLTGRFRGVRVQWVLELGIGELRRHTLGRPSLTVLGVGTMIVGIIILMGAILIFKGRAKEGAITVVAFSTLSIFTGGGYLAGLILGVIGGALALSKI